MFPRTAVGAVVGIGGMAGPVGGVLFSVSGGKILTFTHSDMALFGMSASVYPVSVAVLQKVDVTK